MPMRERIAAIIWSKRHVKGECLDFHLMCASIPFLEMKNALIIKECLDLADEIMLEIMTGPDNA